MKLVKIVFALTAAAAAAGTWAEVPHTYRCERLVSGLGASDINDRGTISGSVEVEGDGIHPAIWRGRNVEALPHLAGFEGADTRAFSINRKGDMAGVVSTGGGLWPVLWTEGVGRRLPLLPHAADDTGEAFSLNSRGHAVGYSINSLGVEHAALWKNGKVIDLGALKGPDGARKIASRAHAINFSGMVVGRSETPERGYHAVQWSNGTAASLVDLGATAFGIASEARAVNGNGVVIGASSVGDDGVMRRPIGWIGGAAFDLKPVQGVDTGVTDINDTGTVVGYIDEIERGALVWPHYFDAPIDLNALLDGNGCRDADGNPARLIIASAINSRGQILATGMFEFPKFESFRLTPLD